MTYLLVLAVAILAITLHEAAHGYVAGWLGDRTPELAGRRSLNPLRHLDPFGTLVVPSATLLLFGLMVGWAKPVPLRLFLSRRRRAVIALAGPACNALQAAAWWWLGEIAPLGYLALAGLQINAAMALLNLLPIPPLDGGRVLAGVVSERAARRLERVEPYGLGVAAVLLVCAALALRAWR